MFVTVTTTGPGSGAHGFAESVSGHSRDATGLGAAEISAGGAPGHKMVRVNGPDSALLSITRLPFAWLRPPESPGVKVTLIVHWLPGATESQLGSAVAPKLEPSPSEVVVVTPVI